MAAAAGRRALRRPPLLSAEGGPHPGALCAAALAALLSLGVAARAGALTHLWDFLDYGAGVLSLVSLTAAVLWGLAATDRTLLASGHRLVAQGAHRGLAVAGLGFLALHVWVKVAEARTTATAVLVPYADPGQPVLIGLGTLAGYLFVAVAVSGAVRSAFATKGRSLWWRALHMGAYPAWGASLVHGLKSGRAASGWVTVAYALCVIGVACLLALRLRTRLRALSGLPARAAAPRSAPARAEAPRPEAARAAAPRAGAVLSGGGPAVAAWVPGQRIGADPRPFVPQPVEQAGDRMTARLVPTPFDEDRSTTRLVRTRQRRAVTEGAAADPLLTPRAAAGPVLATRSAAPFAAAPAAAPPPFPGPDPVHERPPYDRVFLGGVPVAGADGPGGPLGEALGGHWGRL
ncbi:hypothetical protein [Streptomyces sp. G-G2]|uniref:hypothetical protein n=1 Tax=Streptomyces sp. G-G2 TaxID=3046201 RepID=UPI0024BB246D|nr:hypothetical protein [Streptomyces sp. G-G2]MDJ0382753.1 hypothetical protein [Streptomyces sp. G-G2]